MCFSRIGGTGDEGVDVETGHGYRQESYGSEHGEASADVVGDHIGLVAFLSGEAAESAAFLIGDGNDALRGFLAAKLTLELLFEQAESDCRFGGSA